jgi:hypothetical protein
MANANQSGDTGCSLRPFERNRYFYGKLMTVRDFDTEQRYHTEKLRTIDRLLLGEGVVCGLRTAQDGPRRVRIGRGVALDCCGREIVVDTDLTVDLTTVEGAPTAVTGGGTPTLYLCVCYTECTREPVPAPANTSSCQEVCEHNRIQESYRLVLLDTLPETDAVDLCAVWRPRVTLFTDASLRIERAAPRWVARDEIFEVRLIVTTVNPGMPAVSVTEHLSGLTAVSGLTNGRVDFPAAAQGTVFERTYLLRAGTNLGTGSITATAITAGGAARPPLGAPSTVEAVAGPVADRVVEAFREGDLGICHECSGDSCVPLAALTLNGSESPFAVSALDPFPGSAFAYSNQLLYSLLSCAERRIGPQGIQGVQGPQGQQGIQGIPGPQGVPGPAGTGNMRAGLEEIPIIDSRGGISLDSGFGHSRFCVHLGVELNPGTFGSSFVFGNPFPGDDTAIFVQANVPSDGGGRFDIQVFSRGALGRSVRVRWCAVEAEPEGEPTLTFPTLTLPTLTFPTRPTFTINPTLTISTRPTLTISTRPTFPTFTIDPQPTLTISTRPLPTFTIDPRPTVVFDRVTPITPGRPQIPLTEVSGVGNATAEKLGAADIKDARALAEASPDDVAAALGFRDPARAETLISAARKAIEE